MDKKHTAISQDKIKQLINILENAQNYKNQRKTNNIRRYCFTCQISKDVLLMILGANEGTVKPMFLCTGKLISTAFLDIFLNIFSFNAVLYTL